MGVPHPRSGWGVPPTQNWMGYPPLGLNGVLPIQDWMGYPLSRTGLGTSSCPELDMGTFLPPCQGLDGEPPPPPVRRQSSKASICYAAGGMPLAFTQDDFLVYRNVHTGLRQGRNQNSVSCGSGPASCPYPGPVQCESAVNPTTDLVVLTRLSNSPIIPFQFPELSR